MNFYVVSIFPEIFSSFLETSLIKKGVDSGKINFILVNPRDFTQDNHKQIDDEIYGGGKGMLMKAKPIIDTVEYIVSSRNPKLLNDSRIIYLSPSEKFFDQQMAFDLSNLENVILVCGRYEGIDYRFEQYFENNYKNIFHKVSLGKFILLGGEVASMVMIEAIARLVPGVIKETESFVDESYNPTKNMSNIEYPQYTRPEEVYGMKVPEVLLSGHHKKIQEWKNSSEETV